VSAEARGFRLGGIDDLGDAAVTQGEQFDTPEGAIDIAGRQRRQRAAGVEIDELGIALGKAVGGENAVGRELQVGALELRQNGIVRSICSGASNSCSPRSPGPPSVTTIGTPRRFNKVPARSSSLLSGKGTEKIIWPSLA
jgi:hypothetical protein